MSSDTTVTVLVGVAMVAGLFGTVIPFVPGLPLIWGAALVYGLNGGFDAAAWIAMIVITILLGIGVAAKIILPQRRLTESGAPRSTLLAGAVGAIVGFFVIPVVGMPVGGVAGVLVAEYGRTQDWSKAWVSTKAVVIGFGIGTLVEMTAGVAMILAWVAWVITT